MNNIELPDLYTETITIYDAAGTALLTDVAAGIVTGENWMRDQATDVGFVLNNSSAAAQALLDAWANTTGQFRVKWLNNSLRYWAYAVVAFQNKKQILLVTAPAGAASLTPPIGGTGTTPTLQQVTDSGAATTDQITIGGINTVDDAIIISLNNDSGGFALTSSSSFYATIRNNLPQDRIYDVPNFDGTIQVGPNIKKYIALLTQTGTSAPTAVVLENTLGATPTFSRTGTGAYNIITSGLFALNKTVAVASSYTQSGAMRVLSVNHANVNTVELQTLNMAGSAVDINATIPITIIVYP